MSFPRYTKYKDSGVAWACDIPDHWSVTRLKNVFELMKRDPEDGDEIVTAFRDGKVTLRTNRRVDGFTHAAQEHGYQRVLPNDLVIHAMDAFAGAIGVSDSAGKSTPVYSVCRARSPQTCVAYFGRLLRHMALSDFVQALAKGIRERSTEFRWKEASQVLVPEPPPVEQATIAAFLDRETAKIDALIAEQQRLVGLLDEQLKALALSAFNAPSTAMVRLGAATDVVSRPLLGESGTTYTRLGLYNRGRGIFHKDPSEPEEMGDSDFFWVEEGDLILSGQFAWEGAVAIAGPEESRCVVSHRYPIVRGKPGILRTEFLFALLCTAHGDFLLNENSRGAAGRNRPLNIGSLLKEKVPVPDIRLQDNAAQIYHQRQGLLKEVAIQHALLQERRSALISAAVTGQIDVRGLAGSEAA